MARRILLILMATALTIVFYAFVLRLALLPVVVLPALPGGIMTPTLVLWLFSICHAIYMLGWRQAAIFFVVSAVISWLLEQIGVQTGLIYGAYHYTDQLGVKLGHVPLLIPIAWFMMMYPSYVIANIIGTGKPDSAGNGLSLIVWLSALGAMVMTAWDLVMDPGMSSPPSQSWIWEHGGPYFGVPLQNFVGWLLTTFIVFFLYRLIESRMGARPIAPMTTLLAALPLAAYFMVFFPYLLPGGGDIGESLRIVSLFGMGFPLLAAAGRLLFKPEHPSAS